MILEVLFVMVMFLWFLFIIPHPSIVPFAWAGSILAFISVLLLGLFLFVPGIR